MESLTVSTDLIKIEEKEGKLLTTSLNVAEVFGKEHKNVLKDIRELDCSDEFNRLNFEPISYEDSYGRSQSAMAITRDGFSFLVMGYTGKKAAQFKEQYITKFNQMEQKLKANAPQNYIEALKALIAKEEQALLNQPKVEAYEQFISGENHKTVGAVAKALGTGRTRLFAFLKDRGLLMTNNIPYQRCIDAGWFVVKEKPITMGELNTNYSQTYVTPKGEVYLSKLLKKEAIHS